MGNDVHIVTTSYAHRLLQEFDYDTETYLYEQTSFKRMGINDFINVRRMLAKMPEKKFDIIYAPGETFKHIVASSIARRTFKVPVVASFNLFNPDETRAIHYFLSAFKKGIYGKGTFVHLKIFPRRILATLKCYIRNSFARNIDLIFSVGSYLKELLVKMGVNPERIFVISAGVDFDRIQKVGYEEKVYDACFMGQIIPRKGVADLIESWRLVVKEKQDARLAIMGSGPQKYETVIKHLIKKYGLQNNVSMLGFVPEDEKYRILKGSRVFVFPSYWEAFAQAICEAMACELPVIAYNLPVYNEFYGDAIMDVDRGDTKGLLLSIIRLLEDKKLQKRMGSDGLEVARQYKWENIAKDQLNVINRRLLSR